MSDTASFYRAFDAAVREAGLELHDHWHDDEDTSIVYKLRDPRSGKVMRFTIAYTAAADAEAGAREGNAAVARFLNRA